MVECCPEVSHSLILTGVGIGLASGITGVGIRQKKKKKVQQAIDEDATMTEEIEIKMEKVMKDRRKRKIADYLGA